MSRRNRLSTSVMAVTASPHVTAAARKDTRQRVITPPSLEFTAYMTTKKTKHRTGIIPNIRYLSSEKTRGDYAGAIKSERSSSAARGMQLEVESLQVPLWLTEDDQLFWSAAACQTCRRYGSGRQNESGDKSPHSFQTQMAVVVFVKFVEFVAIKTATNSTN